MSKSPRIHFAAAALLIVSLACGLPAASTVPTVDTGALSTAIGQTVVAGLTQNAPLPLFTPTLELIPTLTSSFTPEPPTVTLPPTSTSTETGTPTQTLTSTPVFTVTSQIPLVSVSIATNCRVGPGKVYQMVGALLVGKFAEVYARDPSNNYWYIRNPDNRADFCWVWGEYATLYGPVFNLPVFTPPPTPTATLTPTPSPSFTTEYISHDTCSPAWWANIKLKNTGPLPFKSASITVRDKATSVVVSKLADGFTFAEGCLKTTSKDILGIDDSFTISTPSFSYNPAGHNVQVTIILCSELSQKGTCITNKFIFKP